MRDNFFIRQFFMEMELSIQGNFSFFNIFRKPQTFQNCTNPHNMKFGNFRNFSCQEISDLIPHIEFFGPLRDMPIIKFFIFLKLLTSNFSNSNSTKKISMIILHELLGFRVRWDRSFPQFWRRSGTRFVGLSLYKPQIFS